MGRMGCRCLGCCGDVGVLVVWVGRAPWPPGCPHPSPLPPSGRGGRLLWEGVFLRRGWVVGRGGSRTAPTGWTK